MLKFVNFTKYVDVQILSMRTLDVVLKKKKSKLTFPVVLDTSTNNQTTSYKRSEDTGLLNNYVLFKQDVSKIW